MVTMKFAPLREARQESHNVEEYKLLPFMFESGPRQVYSNMNLSIMVDDYCNANCQFCVAQLRYENRAKQYQKPKIHDDDAYYARLDEMLSFLAPLNPSVSITGGEPSKSRRLPQILNLINKHGYRKRTLTTNGSGLFDEHEGKTMLQHIIDNKFQHLNISKAHYDEDVNKRIMQYDAGTGYCSNEMLSRIAAYSMANNLRPRMSCVLLKNGVASLEDMIKYMEFYQDLGMDNVIFRELMDYDQESMGNAPKIAFNRENKIKLMDVWSQLDGDTRFTPIRNLMGYYYYVEVYRYQNVDMCSEGANLVKLYNEKAKHPDVVYEMVFHPNGNLNGSWVDSEDVLQRYPGKI